MESIGSLASRPYLIHANPFLYNLTEHGGNSGQFLYHIPVLGNWVHLEQGLENYGHRSNLNCRLFPRTSSWNTTTQFSYGLISEKARLMGLNSHLLPVPHKVMFDQFWPRTQLWNFISKSPTYLVPFCCGYLYIHLLGTRWINLQQNHYELLSCLLEVIIYAFCMIAQGQALCLPAGAFHRVSENAPKDLSH